MNFVDNAKLHWILNDDELPLFTSNNGDMGLCLVINDDFCEYVIVHSLSHIHLHILRQPWLENCEEGLCLVDASINWQFLRWEFCSVFKMGVLLHWYHMHMHSNKLHFMLHIELSCWWINYFVSLMFYCDWCCLKLWSGDLHRLILM